MSRVGIVAWMTFGLSVLAIGTALVVWAVLLTDPLTPDIVLFPAAYLGFGAVGALIVSRQASNRIGRLGLVTCVGGAIVALVDSYARIPQAIPGQDWAAWIGAWGFPATLGPILFLLLLFPTGRLASPRWRIVAWVVGAGVVLVGLGNALSPRLADYEGRTNPVALAALAGSPLDQGGVAWFLVLTGAVAVAGGLVPRLRRASGIERQQLKWMTFAAALHGIAWLVLALDLPGSAGKLATYGVFVTLCLIPAAAGIAILRYRLYEIDVVIRRTLVYAGVVAILGAVYVALVLGLQAVLANVVGGETLPVALSTLAIAALFSPVRARVREVVDRRFYRARYDAQRTVESFAGRLREEMELEAVGRALATTVGDAVHPASIGVWLRERGRA